MKDALDWAETLQTALEVPGSFGDTYTRFYPYSFLNQVLLWSQGVAEPVATYKRWVAMGRNPVVGHKKRAIRQPINVRGKDADGKETRRLVGFKMVKCLIVLSDTDGAELPGFEPPTWSLDKALAELGITREPFRLIDGNTQGYSSGRTFAINPVAVHPFKTTLHELAHIVLGHTKEADDDAPRPHRGVAEFQAESVALLLMKELAADEHFDESETRAYIQHWLAGDNPPVDAIGAVFTAVDTILKAGRT